MSALTQITTEAKKIRRKSPGTSWKSAIKKASAKYRGKQRGKARPATPKKPKVKRVTTTRRRVGDVRASVPTGTFAQNIARAKSMVLHEISKLQARKLVASTKTEKKQLAKKIQIKLTVYRKLC